MPPRVEVPEVMRPVTGCEDAALSVAVSGVAVMLVYRIRCADASEKSFAVTERVQPTPLPRASVTPTLAGEKVAV